jgi:NCAIR mutase (PurE)-related protein
MEAQESSDKKIRRLCVDTGRKAATQLLESVLKTAKTPHEMMFQVNSLMVAATHILATHAFNRREQCQVPLEQSIQEFVHNLKREFEFIANDSDEVTKITIVAGESDADSKEFDA